MRLSWVHGGQNWTEEEKLQLFFITVEQHRKGWFSFEGFLMGFFGGVTHSVVSSFFSFLLHSIRLPQSHSDSQTHENTVKFLPFKVMKKVISPV